MKIVEVEFKKKGKQYLFFDDNLELSVDDNVIVETEKGQQYGTIRSISANNSSDDHAKVLRKATAEDEKQNLKNISDAEKSVEKAQEISEQLGLDMKFISSFYTFDRKQMVFNFIADSRVDFRELAKSLANIYKTRIELR